MTTVATGIGISRLGQVQIGTQDVERAADFYENVLGLKLLFKAPPGLAFFDCGGVRLMLSAPEGARESYSSVLYFRVPDMQVAHRELAARGVQFESAPHVVARMPDYDLWMAFFRDPDRNLLALMCEEPRIAA